MVSRRSVDKGELNMMKKDDYWNAARCIGDICNAPERRK